MTRHKQRHQQKKLTTQADARVKTHASRTCVFATTYVQPRQYLLVKTKMTHAVSFFPRASHSAFGVARFSQMGQSSKPADFASAPPPTQDISELLMVLEPLHAGEKTGTPASCSLRCACFIRVVENHTYLPSVNCWIINGITGGTSLFWNSIFTAVLGGSKEVLCFFLICS